MTKYENIEIGEKAREIIEAQYNEGLIDYREYEEKKEFICASLSRAYALSF